MQQIQNKIKLDNNFTFLKPGEQDKLHVLNYRLPHLKAMCKHYGVSRFHSANKKSLIMMLFSFLKNTECVQLIQKTFRRFMLKKYIMAKGPAYIKRHICVNDTDFFTMDKISEVEFEQFISFTDKDTKVYGFDVLSLHNLVSKGAKPTRNPYNRNEIPKELVDNMNLLVKFSHIYFKKIEVQMKEPVLQNTVKCIELSCISLFQEINNLGNYTEYTWFWSLNKHSLIRFINYVADIWSYRANLSYEMKRNICPPHGDPFLGTSVHGIRSMDLNKLRKTCISIIKNIVLTSSVESNRTLGANYVLCALTLVNDDAASSLPWLYQSVIY